MEAKELRIGNYISFNCDDSSKDVSQVTSISLDDIGDYQIDTYFDLDEIQGVPLTEEMLFKCKHIKESVFFDGNENKGIYLGIEDDEEFLCLVSFPDGIFLYEQTDGESWGYVGNKVEFLHDLQNIFYHYNNNKIELEINL